MIYEISNKNIKLEVNSLGAQMMSIIFNGKERLWQNENGSWPKHAPILFPHASKCSIIVDGKRYKDNFHGFARDLEWELIEKKSDSITMLLKDCPHSKEQYPFNFNLIQKYTLLNDGIEISQTVVNTDNREIYFALGSHEAYALERNLSGYYIEFEKPETNKEVGMVNSKIFDLNHDLLHVTSVAFNDLKSRKVYLKEKLSGKVIVETEFKDYPVLVVWHSKGSQMICIEPWLNESDTEETDKLEFKDKKHIIKLKKNSSKNLVRTIRFF